MNNRSTKEADPPGPFFFIAMAIIITVLLCCGVYNPPQWVQATAEQTE